MSEATFDQDRRSENENKKFVADANGDTAVRVLIAGGVQLTSGALFEIKDPNGFVVFSVDEFGNIRHTGSIIKI